MKINQIINENTTAGSIAPVSAPLGSVQKRADNKKSGSMFKGKTTNKPFYEDQVNEEDRIIAPGKGNKVKPGLLNKPEVSPNPTDSVKLDVPLLIRLLEFAREDASNDLDLHDLAEKLVQRGTRGKTLTMKDYEFVVDECMSGGVIAGGGVGEGSVSKEKQKTPYRNINSPEYKAAAEKQHQQMARDKAAEPGKHLLNKIAKKGVAQEGEKVDRMVKHIAKSERGLGHSKKEAENIAWATANKRGMLDNKNKK